HTELVVGGQLVEHVDEFREGGGVERVAPLGAVEAQDLDPLVGASTLQSGHDRYPPRPMRRLVATSFTFLVFFLLTVGPALAATVGDHDGGQGTYGEANDKVVTNAGFIVIIFFPLLILLLSLLQNFLDKRKARRKKTLPARDWAGGW